MRATRLWVAVLAAAALALFAHPARAFCGFYVGGAGAKLFNNASIVVLMRDGTRTVLSMQNNYQGPPDKFAMVVPVPVVLKKEDVKTLPSAIFDRVDELAAPRLVEYWEEDPCANAGWGGGGVRRPAKSAPRPKPTDAAAPAPPAVRVLAQFVVGEYDIVILGADDSMALDKWLRTEGYQIPSDAEPYLRPYVQAGMKFFVAKVDPTKVRFQGGQAMLSPLRFHYDSDTFFLPVRLGLANSSGTQDLIVHVLARQRYEVANFDNVAIPTNLNVSPGAKKTFASFYAALFDKTLEKNPGAVVTEYAWDASWCDPCPTPALTPQELAVLGADVLPAPAAQAGGFVLTRLHARYGKSVSGEDLVFRQAPAIAGGREEWGEKGLETGAQAAQTNTFQGRYAVRYPWTGPVTCKNPERGNWGGPPEGLSRTSVTPALKLASAPRTGISLSDLIAPPFRSVGLGGGSKLGRGSPADPLSKLGVSGTTTAAPSAVPPSLPGTPPVPGQPPSPTQAAPRAGGCAGCTLEAHDAPTAPWLLALAIAAAAARVRRRHRDRRGRATGRMGLRRSF